MASSAEATRAARNCSGSRPGSSSMRRNLRPLTEPGLIGTVRIRLETKAGRTAESGDDVLPTESQTLCIPEVIAAWDPKAQTDRAAHVAQLRARRPQSGQITVSTVRSSARQRLHAWPRGNGAGGRTCR